eukprot:7208695-Prymnesium_polylepis.1
MSVPDSGIPPELAAWAPSRLKPVYFLAGGANAVPTPPPSPSSSKRPMSPPPGSPPPEEEEATLP